MNIEINAEPSCGTARQVSAVSAAGAQIAAPRRILYRTRERTERLSRHAFDWVCKAASNQNPVFFFRAEQGDPNWRGDARAGDSLGTRTKIPRFDRLVPGERAMHWKLLRLLPVITPSRSDITRSALGATAHAIQIPEWPRRFHFRGRM